MGARGMRAWLILVWSSRLALDLVLRVSGIILTVLVGAARCDIALDGLRVDVFKETASGADNARPERAKVLALARAHEIDAILVTELSRWGRSTQDLVQTLDDLHGWKVSVLAQTGLSFDLSTASGKLMRTIMAGLAEFERDLIRDRVKSGLAAARARGVKLGRQVGQRPSDKKAKRVLGMHADGLSYRLIARNVGMSKNTVMDIVRRSVGR